MLRGVSDDNPPPDRARYSAALLGFYASCAAVSAGAAMFFFAWFVLTKAGYGNLPIGLKIVGALMMAVGLPGAFIGRGNLGELLPRQRQRLFHEDVLAGLDRGAGESGVGIVASSNNHRVDLGIGDQAIHVRRNFAEVELAAVKRSVDAAAGGQSLEPNALPS